MAVYRYRIGDAGSESTVRLAGQSLEATTVHRSDLHILRAEFGGLLGIAGVRARRRGSAQWTGIFCLVQCVQPVRHDGVLGVAG